MLSVRGKWLHGMSQLNLSVCVIDFENHPEKKGLEEEAGVWNGLFVWTVCSVLLTCVWTTHHLPCSIDSSFTGQCERKTHSFMVCKETLHISGRVPKYISNSRALSISLTHMEMVDLSYGGFFLVDKMMNKALVKDLAKHFWVMLLYILFHGIYCVHAVYVGSHLSCHSSFR